MNEANLHVLALRSRRTQSTTSLVRDAIEQMSIDGVLKAGEHVSETALAAHLGVSRGPIREACRALVESGLLVAEANRGFFVRKLSLAEVIDVYEVRASLARLAGRALAARATDEQIAELARLVDEMSTANERHQFDAFYGLNLEFHDKTYEFCGNKKIIEINKGLMRDLHIFRRRGLIAGDNTRNSNAEHKQILHAIMSRDVEAAGDALEQHILHGKDRFLAAVGREVE